MPAEHVDDGAYLLYGNREAPSDSQDHAATLELILSANDASADDGSKQFLEDVAVAAELRRLVLSRLPDDVSARVVLCEDPEAAGISREALAVAMEEAYGRAGIGDRAEGMRHFEKLFRGYDDHDHGPTRFVIIWNTSRRVWVLCDYFRVYDDYGVLGAPYAPAAGEWKQRTELQPGEYVMSKLVNTQYLAADRRIRRIAAGLGARVFASIVQGLANANKHGMLLAGNAQLGTRNFVLGRLGSLLTGQLEVVFDEAGGGEDGAVPQAQMMIYVSPASDKEQ
jgi:hypothetical protein